MITFIFGLIPTDFRAEIAFPPSDWAYFWNQCSFLAENIAIRVSYMCIYIYI